MRVDAGGTAVSGPMHPVEYDPEDVPELEADGWATGLDVWAPVEKAYVNALGGENTLANAQLWSLREAIRAEYAAELAQLAGDC